MSTQSFSASPLAAGQILDTAVARFATRPALDFLGKRLTYAQLGRLADGAATGLQALGVGKGVKVGLCLPNTPYSVILYFAVLKAGGTVVNFNPLYTQHEMEVLAAETETSVIATIDVAAVFPKIEAMAAKGLFRRVIVCRLADALPWPKSVALRVVGAKQLARIPQGPLFLEYRALLRPGVKPQTVEIDPARDLAVLQFTGGTTGTPKAAMLTHANLTANVEQIKLALPPMRLGEERVLALLPMFHVFCMTCVMNFGLTNGAELILLPKLDIKQAMNTIYNRRPTILPGVPTLFTALSNAAEKDPRGDMSFIKFCVSGGAPLSLEVMERFERLSHSRIVEGYGLSETSPVLCISQVTPVKPGSVGPAVAGTELQIRDPANPERILPQGERGEICVRGPQVMTGYYKRPEETAHVFTDGFFRTGDVGYLDEDGCLFIVDRIKDVILCGGFNVYPRVIEEAAYQHPAVQDAVAIGIPDAYRGQAPKLYITLREGAEATPQEILDFLGTQLNRIEIPRSVEIRDYLPKTMVGKLSKKELIAENKA